MIPRSDALRQPGPRIVLLTKIKARTVGLGSRTMAFFRKGEELEATRFETVPHDDPMLVPPKLGFRSFDRVPRHHAPLLITVLLVAVGAVAVFGWRSVRSIPDRAARAATSVGSKASSEWLGLKAAVHTKIESTSGR
jgi:hypothetical protein